MYFAGSICLIFLNILGNNVFMIKTMKSHDSLKVYDSHSNLALQLH